MALKVKINSCSFRVYTIKLFLFRFLFTGERLIQYATENLVTEVLIHPQINTLLQCVRNALSSFTRHRHLIHAGYTFASSGSWILQVNRSSPPLHRKKRVQRCKLTSSRLSVERKSEVAMDCSIKILIISILRGQNKGGREVPQRVEQLRSLDEDVRAFDGRRE